MRQIALAAVLLASAPVDAAARCYSRWFYPWPQRCRSNSWVPGAHELTRPHRVATSDPEIPLPSLTSADFVGGEADEPARARLLLRAILEAPR